MHLSTALASARCTSRLHWLPVAALLDCIGFRSLQLSTPHPPMNPKKKTDDAHASCRGFWQTPRQEHEARFIGGRGLTSRSDKTCGTWDGFGMDLGWVWDGFGMGLGWAEASSYLPRWSAVCGGRGKFLSQKVTGAIGGVWRPRQILTSQGDRRCAADEASSYLKR